MRITVLASVVMIAGLAGFLWHTKDMTRHEICCAYGKCSLFKDMCR